METLELTLLIILLLGSMVFYLTLEYKRLIIGPGYTFTFVWTVIILNTIIPISSLTRTPSERTIYVLISAFLSYILGYILSLFLKTKQSERFILYSNVKHYILLTTFICLLVANIIFSGYIPIISLIQGNDSGYITFGIPTIYGLFNAYSNFLGIYFYYLYLKTGNKKYLYIVGIIILTFISLITRQNIITLVVECFVIDVLLKYSKQRLRIYSLTFLLLMVAFSIIGDYRSGDINAIAEIYPQYSWLPTTYIWIYSYSVFNIVNLDNLIGVLNEPLYNFSSLASLVPSFLRPETNVDIFYLEKLNFTIATYLSGIYIDFGLTGIIIFSFFQGYLVNKYYMNSKSGDVSLIIFSVLFTCNILSFFINMFLYLPVIGQLIFACLILRSEKV